MRRFLAQFTTFGLVGLIGLVVDFGVFNLLLNTVFAPERVQGGPLLAKVVSTSIAIVGNWIGNRLWTFREHRGPQLWREGLEFGLVSVGGLLIGVGCLWVSHYGLGFTSRLADNIASNVVGLALGTAFRFLLYRYWVFRPRRGEPHVFEDEPLTTGPRDPAPVVARRGAVSRPPRPVPRPTPPGK